MRTIYKYLLGISEVTLQMPSAAIVQHVGVDPEGMMALWAEVDTDDNLVDRRFHIEGTGHPVPPYWIYLGSFMHLNAFMWHVFEEVL